MLSVTRVTCVSIVNTFLQAYIKLRTKFESEMAVILQKQLRVGFNVLFYEFSSDFFWLLANEVIFLFILHSIVSSKIACDFHALL